MNLEASQWPRASVIVVSREVYSLPWEQTMAAVGEFSETVADPVDQSAFDEDETDQAACLGSHGLEEDTNQEEEHRMACQGTQDQVETLADQSADSAEEGSNTGKEAAGIAEAVAVVVE